METEIWKSVIGYEGHYEVSSFGNVRSVDRIVKADRCVNGKDTIINRNLKGKDLKPCIGKIGYREVGLTMDGSHKTNAVRKLVAMAFHNHKPNGSTMVIDHIDGNKINDYANNIRIVTFRYNITLGHTLKNEYKTSKYTGVCRGKNQKKWVAYICVNGENKRLGLFEKEIDASDAYNSALLEIQKNKLSLQL